MAQGEDVHKIFVIVKLGKVFQKVFKIRYCEIRKGFSKKCLKFVIVKLGKVFQKSV